jgi:hypothetical protein
MRNINRIVKLIDYLPKKVLFFPLSVLLKNPILSVIDYVTDKQAIFFIMVQSPDIDLLEFAQIQLEMEYTFLRSKFLNEKKLSQNLGNDENLFLQVQIKCFCP